jgi:hypothetical protein
MLRDLTQLAAPRAYHRREVWPLNFGARISAHMRPEKDPDLLLIETMTAPPPLEDARRSLVYWQERQRALPIYKRRARQEAREMAARWDARVREAERALFATTVAGRILIALGLSNLLFLRERLTKRGVASFAWALVPAPIKLVAGGIAAAWLIVAIATTTLAAAVLVHLA